MSWSRALLLGCCLAFVPVSARAAVPAEVRWAKSPAWVQELPIDVSAPIDPDLARHGTYALLRDVRVRLGPRSVERYSRSVRKAVSQSGVQELGEVQVEYSPQFERLLLHRAALIRGGQLLDQTGKASFRLLDSEDQQEQGIYSGRVSALLVLSDVRVGDVIDVAFSVVGNNPVLGERFAGHIRLGGETSVRRVHVQVSSAASRAPLHWSVRGTAPEPSKTESDGQRVLTWDLKDVPPPPQEDRVPETFARPAVLELSEFTDWSEVARWAAGLYPADHSASLQAKARELRAAAPELENAALAALRFVQDDVRYLSISLGPHSVKPHTPQSVLAQRFGDCKDKSYLLVELLRALGVEAHPALADTELRVHLRESLPSPYAFDHVVTVIDLGGKRYYVDPTWAHQGGALSRVAPPELGAVLVVAPESTALTMLPEPSEPLEPPRSVAAQVLVGSGGEATFYVTTTFLGSDADGMRAALAAKSPSDLSREYLNYYARRFPELSVAAPLEIKDQRDDDVITIRESYKTPKFWRDGERHLAPDLIWSYLEAPDVTQREAPLALSHPIWVRESLEVSLPFAAEASSNSQTLRDSAATLRQRVEFNGHRVTAQQDYRSLADEVPLAALTRHLQFLAEARKSVVIDLTEQFDASTGPSSSDPATTPRTTTGAGSQRSWLIPVGLIAVGLLGLLIRKARTQKIPEKSDEQRPWVEPAPSLEVARAAFTRVPCECGARIAADAVAFTEVRLDGRTLHSARSDCSECARRRHIYFSLPNAGS